METPSILFKSNKLPSAAWDRFKVYRSQQKFFDVTISIDGNKYRAHKILLSGCSEYFETMFLSSFKESQQDVITLNNIDADSFATILDYFYDRSITLNSENAQDILTVATIMQVRDVQLFCADYIKKMINTTNCLDILITAQVYSLNELLDSAFIFILDKFRQVVNNPESEFVELDVEWLIKLLRHDELHVGNEVEAFKAVIKWLQHGDRNIKMRNIDQLLPLIRYPLMASKTLVKLREIVDDLDIKMHLQTSEKFRQLLDEAKDYHLLKLCNPDECSPVQNFRFKERIPSAKSSQRIFAVGGWDNRKQPLASVERFDPYESIWEEVSPMTRRRCGVGVAIVNNSLYAVGGHDGVNYLKSAERYDILNDVWNNDIVDMHLERTSMSMCVLDNYIYAIGGQMASLDHNQIRAIDDVERYDPRTNTWEICQNLQQRRYGAGIAVLNGLIYVVGGADQRPTNTVECYDPATNTWKYVAPMVIARKHFGCTAYKGKIYAVGGRAERHEEGDLRYTELDSVECYDPISDKWSWNPPMKEERSGIGLVELNGLIYAVGGNCGETKLSRVECFCPRRNIWMESEPLRHERLGGGLIVFSNLARVEENL